MSDETLSEAQTCAALGVDAWGLATLIRRGDIDALKEGRFDADAVTSLANLLKSRREEGLKALAKLDGPHLG